MSRKNSVNSTITPEVFALSRGLLQAAVEVAQELDTCPQLVLALAGALLMGREEAEDYHEHVFTLPDVGCRLVVGFALEPIEAETVEDKAA